MSSQRYLTINLAEIHSESQLGEICENLAWDEQTSAVIFIIDGIIENSYSRHVSRIKQPVIAAIRGDALGAGLELALACDIRIGTRSSRFGLPQIKEGEMPSAGGTQRLPRLIGPGRAMQMVLTGMTIDAEEACRIGLLNRVVAADNLMDAATKIADEMTKQSPLSLNYVKEALYSGMDLTLDQGLRMEMDLYLLLFTTSDRTEGLTAFMEKRPPKFKGI
jgi:enoyl-CoA hydratase/carnithine racemase